MHIYKISEDEILVTDGKQTLRFMARGDLGALRRGEIHLEVESANLSEFIEALCEGCKGYEYAKRMGEICEGCTGAQEQYEVNVK